MFLKQSTAVTVKVGPFVDATDGVTAETGLTISQADIRITKNGGAFAQTNNAAGATHDENGYYGVPLDTTDTGTLGTLRVSVNESGALPVWQDFMIVPANVWDSLFGADKLQVHVDEMTAGIITATVIADGSIDAATFAAGAINAAAIASDAITDAKVASDVTIASVTGAVGSVTGAVGSVTGNVGGNVVGSTGSVVGAVGSVTGAVGSVTGAVGSVTGNVGGNVVGSVASVTAGVTVTTNNDKTGYALSTAGVDAILDDTIGDSTITLRQAVKVMLASLAGKLSGAATTTVSIRNVADDTNVIVATVDADGNRSAVTLTV